ncbi:hypothetical protein Tco_1090598 [Tanacetum coccineum]|uniref:Uncharacterized protein n=1 Tax=Tanacetum coccineum TaxID=301880 RepID=A0ABQ5I4Q1_9ASTR
MKKALTILLSANPELDFFLVFMMPQMQRSLWTALKARFGDSAYERFQNILSMLELYDAKVSLEDANLKFLRSLPSVWHVVATMIRGQPGLDELEFDLSPLQHLKAASSKVQTAPNCASHSDEIICSFFAQQASMPTTHDDEDLLQIDEDAMEEIDIRWQDNNVDIDGQGICSTAEPVTVTFAMMALTELEEDDWSMEIDAEPMHFGQDGLGDFDWSNTADDTPVSLALMATNSEMEYDLKMRDLKLEEKQKELDQALRERDDFKIKLEKWSNAAVLQNEVLNKQRYLSDKTCIGFGVEYSSSEENNNSSGDETLVDPLYENFKREKAYTAKYINHRIVIYMKEPSKTQTNKIREHSGTRDKDQVEQHPRVTMDNPEEDLKDYAIIDSGCLWKLTGDHRKAVCFKSSRQRRVMWLLVNDLRRKNLRKKETIKTSCIDLSNSDDDIPKEGVFFTNSFDAKNTDTEEGGAVTTTNHGFTIDVTSTPTLRIHKIHPQSQIIGKSTAGMVQSHGKSLKALADESWVNRCKKERFNSSYKRLWVLCGLTRCKQRAIDKNSVHYQKDRSDIMLYRSYAKGIQDDSMGWNSLSFWGLHVSKTSAGPDIMFAVLSVVHDSSHSKGFSLACCKKTFQLQEDVYILVRSRSLAMQNKQYGISSTSRILLAAASCCAQYFGCKINCYYGFNCMHTEIHIENELVPFECEDHVFHSKTKAYSDSTLTSIRDCYEQRSLMWSQIAFLSQDIWERTQKILVTRSSSTSWEQFGTNIASALVGLATNQKFNFSLMILNGMLGHISNGTPFLMYPRYPDQSAAQASVSQRTAEVQGTANSQGTDEVSKVPGTVTLKGLLRYKVTVWTSKVQAELTVLLIFQKSQGLYSHRCVSNICEELEGRLDLDAFNREEFSTLQSKETKKEARSKSDPFFEDIVDKDAAVTLDMERKSDETEEINIEEKKASDVKSGDTEELDLDVVQTTDPKDKGKRDLGREPKKKKLNSSKIRAFGGRQMMGEVARRFKLMGCRRRKERLEELKKSKAKGYLSCSRK